MPKARRRRITHWSPLPKNASYTDSKKTTVKLAAAFQGTLEAGKYASTIKTVDAASSKN